MVGKKGEIPEETERIAKASFPKGNGYMRLREEYGRMFEEEEFADLYSWKGEEEIPGSYLATVTVLQYVEGLTDRQAAEQVRSRIDWKYLLGEEITYAGFDQSALSRFRERLIEKGAEERLFEMPLKRMGEMGLVGGRGRQRTDSTYVLAQIRVLNRVELVGETMRQALNEVAVMAPEWLSSWVPEEWYERYGVRIEEMRLPREKSKREALSKMIAEDGYRLLREVSEAESLSYLLEIPSIQILRRVWLQQFYGPHQLGVWREKEDLPPGAEMINSPYDLDARYSRKRKTAWTGYKVHLSESCDEENPHLITHVETTPATEPDCVTLPTIHQSLAHKQLLPAEHLVDAGYMNVQNLVTSRQEQNIDLVGPMRPDNSWQAREETGYDISHFVVDWEHHSVTCPQGHASHHWSSTTSKDGVDSINVRFHKDDCSFCPVRQLCTRSQSTPRTLQLQPSPLLHHSLQHARTSQTSPEFQDRYRSRAGIEGTISQATRSFDLRRTRFIGHAKTRLQHLATASAINFSRLRDWWDHLSRSSTRSSSFLELNPYPLP